MLRIEQRLAPAARRRTGSDQPWATLRLPFESRCRSRLAACLQDGRDVVLLLPRGTVLRHGDLLQADDGTVVRVEAQPQAVLRVTSPHACLLLRAAYHLGNRHVAVEVTATMLQLEPDPVLRDMLLGLGVAVQELEAPFEPEAGAYGGGHRHGHDASFAEDHALAQAAFDHRHAPPHSHDH